MRHPSRWRLPAGIGVIGGALVLSVSGLAAPAFASTGPVSNVPVSGTPELAYGSGVPLQQINVMKQCGNTVFVGGNFSQVTQGGTTYTRNGLFSFSATAPYTLTSWSPNVNGTVQGMAIDGANCSDVYIGGSFSEVGSTSAENLAEVSASTGAIDTAFGHDANGEIDTMAVFGSHILAGGAFTDINGSSADKYYASLNVTTGQNDGYLALNVSGNYQYSGVHTNTTRIYSQQVSHGGARVMVEGDFTSVGGQKRQQIFQLWLNPSKGAKASVTAWTAPVFDQHCVVTEPFYAQEAAWSPTDNEVYVATTGNHVYEHYTLPVIPPCDMALAFSANETSENPAWTNPTGCDSLLSVISDSSAVYFAGHERWTQNPDGCNVAGTGAIQDYGMEGVSPTTGKVMLNSSGTPEYSMSRADGDYMMITSAGLWIGSTNRFDDNSCNGVSNLSGICFLPYPSS